MAESYRRTDAQPLVEDSELMQRYASGDALAFDELYARYRHKLYHYVLRRCGNEADAREIYQDIWANVVNARHAYRADALFGPWFWSIARNRITDVYRRQKHRAAAAHQSFDDNAASDITQLEAPLSPELMAEVLEHREWLQTALNALPDAQREAIVCRHVAGMTLQEMTELSGDKPEAIKSRLRYAMVKLRQQLRELA